MKTSLLYGNRYLQLLGATGALLLSLGLLPGCEAPQATEQRAQTQEASNAQAKEPVMDSQEDPARNADPAADLDAVLKKGMAYGNFRRLALSKGWQPVVNPQCKANLVGEGASDLCAKNPQMVSCRICDELPELDSCSSDAHCLMRFRHPDGASMLSVTGYGEVEYWDETGDEAGLQVTDWEFAAPKGK